MKFMSSFFFIFIILTSSFCFSQDLGREDASIFPFFFAQPSVLKDLELVEGQRQVVVQLQTDMQRAIKEYGLSGLPLMGDPVALEARKNQLRDEVLEIGKSIDAQLLPHQRKRLSQLYLRYKITVHQKTDSRPLLLKVDGLNLTAEQNGLINKKADEFENELRALLEKHRRELREFAEKRQLGMLEFLKPNQREVLNEKLGPSFNFERSSPRTRSVKKK